METDTNKERYIFNLKSLTTKLNWKVATNELSSLTGFSFSNFVFEFNINSKEKMEQFTEFLKAHELLMPWDMCNFLLNGNIEFDFKYRYDKYNSLKNNIVLYKTYTFLKNQLNEINKKKLYK